MDHGQVGAPCAWTMAPTRLWVNTASGVQAWWTVALKSPFMPRLHCFAYAMLVPEMSVGAICFTPFGSNGGCWVVLVAVSVSFLKCMPVAAERKGCRGYVKSKKKLSAGSIKKSFSVCGFHQ